VSFSLMIIIVKRNASNTHFNTHFSTHSFWLVKIHMRPTKFTWDQNDLVGPVWKDSKKSLRSEKRKKHCSCLAKCFEKGPMYRKRNSVFSTLSKLKQFHPYNTIVTYSDMTRISKFNIFRYLFRPISDTT